MSYPEEVRSEADRGVYGDHEEQADDVYETKIIIRHTKTGATTKNMTPTALLSFLRQAMAKIRTRRLGWRSKARAEGTYVGVPLEVLVDEPEGSDDGYDGKETRYDPPDIMRYNVPSIQAHNQSMVEKHVGVDR